MYVLQTSLLPFSIDVDLTTILCSFVVLLSGTYFASIQSAGERRAPEIYEQSRKYQAAAEKDVADLKSERRRANQEHRKLLDDIDLIVDQLTETQRTECKLAAIRDQLAETQNFVRTVLMKVQKLANKSEVVELALCYDHITFRKKLTQLARLGRDFQQYLLDCDNQNWGVPSLQYICRLAEACRIVEALPQHESLC